MSLFKKNFFNVAGDGKVTIQDGKKGVVIQKKIENCENIENVRIDSHQISNVNLYMSDEYNVLDIKFDCNMRFEFRRNRF